MPDLKHFPYLPITNIRGETAWRPILPLTLIYRGKSSSAAGLVDTGADVNVLPYGAGLELGIIWDEQTNPVELSGNFAGYEARGIVLSAHIEPFASDIRLVFAWTRMERAPLLLGQVNFLREFNVCFFGHEREFEVQLR